jgi:hypothetical protein
MSVMTSDRMRLLGWRLHARPLVALVVVSLQFNAMTLFAWAGAGIWLVLRLPLLASA